MLIPRPETEGLVDRCAGTAAAEGSIARVLDVATGSGAIALAIARERPQRGRDRHGHVRGRDRRGATQREPARSGPSRVSGRSLVRAGCRPAFRRWSSAILPTSPTPTLASSGRVRRFEPHGALFAGPTGLEALQVLAASAPAHLNARRLADRRARRHPGSRPSATCSSTPASSRSRRSATWPGSTDAPKAAGPVDRGWGVTSSGHTFTIPARFFTLARPARP